MPIFKLDINQTFGGKSSKDTFSNTLHYSGAAALTANAHKTFTDAVAAAWADIILERVRILSLTVTQLDTDGTASSAEPHFKVFDQDLTGKIDIADGVDPALIDVVGNWKKSTNGGRSGALYVRGVIAENNYESSSDLNPSVKTGVTITQYTALSAALIAAAAGSPFTWVIPGTKPETFTSAARNITEFKWVGLTLRQDTNNRKSVAQKERELVRQKLNEAERQRQIEVKNNPTIGTDALVNVLKNFIIPLIKQYGPALILSLLTRRPELRAITVVISNLPELT